jgi:hypothetical protein
MSKKTYKQLEDELFEVGGTLSRLITSDSFNRRESRKYFDRTRSLENAIRRHATGQCKCRNAKQCMSQLVKLVPLKPRPKYGNKVHRVRTRTKTR